MYFKKIKYKDKLPYILGANCVRLCVCGFNSFVQLIVVVVFSFFFLVFVPFLTDSKNRRAVNLSDVVPQMAFASQSTESPKWSGFKLSLTVAFRVADEFRPRVVKSWNSVLYRRFEASNIGLQSRVKRTKVANLSAKPFLAEKSPWRKFDEIFCRRKGTPSWEGFQRSLRFLGWKTEAPLRSF